MQTHQEIPRDAADQKSRNHRTHLWAGETEGHDAGNLTNMVRTVGL